MPQPPSTEIPSQPKLRAVETQWVTYQGQSLLLLRDPTGLADKGVLAPRPMVSLLALCDGTRDLNGLKAALQLRTGLNLSLSELRSWVEQMDASMLLEGGVHFMAVAHRHEAIRIPMNQKRRRVVG